MPLRLQAVTVLAAGLLLWASGGCDSAPDSPAVTTQPAPSQSGSGATTVPQFPPPTGAAEPPASAADIAGDEDDPGRDQRDSRTMDSTPDPDTIYQSWTDPQMVLVLTGQQHGYIEPCGCTGLENQKGGMARRHTLIRQLRERNWPLVPIDAGNQVRRYGRQAEIKFQVAANGLKQMGYEAVGLGADDLRLSSLELIAVTAPSDENPDAPFLSANAAIFDRELTPGVKRIERSGKTVAVTAVIGDEWLAEVKNSDVVKRPAEEAIQAVLPQLEAADLRVLVAQATLAESRALGAKFPQFDIVVSAGGKGDPTYQPERLPEGPLLIRVGDKAMHVGLVGLFDEGERLRYQRIPLTHHFDDSEEMLALLASYQQTLQEIGLEGLGLRPVPHPSERLFVGSESCRECHPGPYEVWWNGEELHGHRQATNSLVNPPNERGDIPRHFDPECLSCHVTGWHPQNYYPYQSGYLSLSKTPEMVGNGCENCHGPGSEHVAAERGDEDVSEEVQLARQAAMRLSLEKAEQDCMRCHDLDNSPDFHIDGAFDEYWDQIAH